MVDTNEAVLREVMACISSGRYGDMLELMHDDLVFELPYAPKGLPTTFDRKSFGEMQSAMFSMFSSFTLEPAELHPLADPDGLIAEYRSDCVVAASGKPYRNRYIGVFRFRDGKVIAWREFFNPEIVTEALSP